ncbi:hypothetical protein [Spiroplasma endosymbiont of Apeira syringaria]|uniref:hypothetical protein n=1 Tax=Spiroplasma endosymbiont of Apeira syringaria TaxID=3066307 RepID=UPI0030CF8E1B
MQDIAVQFEKHFWIHSVSLFPPQVHVGRSPKNNSFIVDNSYTYWVFNLENIKRELSGNELIKLLEPYIKDQKITVNKPTAPKEYYLNDIKLEPLKFYEQHNSWFIGEITDNKTKITNPCFKYNITWEENRKGFKINNGLLPTCTCGGNNETEWIQQCFSNWTAMSCIYSKFERKQMY